MAVKKLQNYINGEWVDSATSEFVEIINPARGEVARCQGTVPSPPD